VIGTRVKEAPGRRLSAALMWQLRRYTEVLLEGPYNVLMTQLRLVGGVMDGWVGGL